MSLYLQHHGILGQKWGVRRYQNPDGTLTAAGRNRMKNTSVIPKNSTMFRLDEQSDKNPDFMNRPYTYVSNTKEFRIHSVETESIMEDFGSTNNYQLKTKKDLKIANLNVYYDALVESLNLNKYKYLSDVPKNIKNKGEYTILNDLLPHNYIEGTGGNNVIFNKVIDNIKSKGFDGVIDPVDGASQIKMANKFNYEYDGKTPWNKDNPPATIVFDPKKNLKIVEIY